MASPTGVVVEINPTILLQRMFAMAAMVTPALSFVVLQPYRCKIDQ